VTAFPPPANCPDGGGSGVCTCPAGGQQIDIGVDTNGDGILEANEIQQTAYVCNGAAGAAGAAGASGTQGAPGPQGPAGSAAPQPGQPSVGDLGGNLGFAKFTAVTDGWIKGGSTASGEFKDWFDLTGFGFSLSIPTTFIGTLPRSIPAGQSRSSAVGASLVLGTGTPLLYSASADTERFTSVEFAFETGGATPFVFFRVLLTNATISNITTSGASASNVPQLSLALTYETINVEYQAQNPDLTAGPITTASWTPDNGFPAPTGTTPALDFVVDGPATAPFDVASTFHPPTVVEPLDPTGRMVIGSAIFTEASVVLPVDATVVSDFMWAGSETHFADSTVELFQTSGATPRKYASFAFQAPLITSIALSGLNATVAFEGLYKVTVP
jgi:type VI protein secretion system component Hcp